MHLVVIGGSDAGISAELRACELDPTVAGREVRMPLREFELLTCLVVAVPRVVSPGEISNYLWGTKPDAPASRAVRLYVQRLRERVGDPNVIRTVRGLGYTVSHHVQ